MSATDQPPLPVPEELETLPPGPMLAELLDSLPAEQVSGFDTVRLLEAAYRQLSHVRALFLSILRETGLRRPGSVTTVERIKAPGEFAAEEARAALVWSRTRASTTYQLAVDVFDRLPVLGQAMLDGRLDEPRVRAFVDWTQGLTDAQADTVCARLLPEAPGLLVGELIDRIKRACIAVDPAWAERRYREAVKTRRVAGSRNPDGTANLGGYSQPIDRIAAASERIDTLARACKRAGDARPIDHIRSDLFLGMTDGTYEGLTESEIVEYVLVHPYTEPGEDDLDKHADGPDGGGSGGDGRPSGSGRPGGGPGGTCDVPEAARLGDQAGARACMPRARVPADGPSADLPSPAAAASSSSAPAATGQIDPPGATRSWAVPELRVELSTLLGFDDHPAEIPPWGYIPAGQAREVVASMYSGEWRYVFCGPDGRAVAGGLIRARPMGGVHRARRDARRGGVVEIAVPVAGLAQLTGCHAGEGPWAAVLAELVRRAMQAPREEDTDTGDSRRRTAGARLRRWVQQRDRQCAHPACRMRAAKTDQDHRIDYASGGQTRAGNLEPACRHDHRLRHEAFWRIDQPEPGLIVWTSPLGHSHASRPPPVIRRLPQPYPDLEGERYIPDGWLVWDNRRPRWKCNEQCECERPILPPVPQRVRKTEPVREQMPKPILDPDEKPPF
ncbi:MAG TPA: DUF222 domain-containing protein [Jiangellaceae bacterium]|nr:DUF222 domain-containing protein [Jiangellaceae bacterium]